MSRHVALLRGINVGAAHRVAMADVIALFQASGFTAVETVLQSGNVLFDAPTGVQSPEEIEHLLADRFGFSIPTVVLDVSSISKAISANPFPEHESSGSKLLCTFLDRRPSAASLKEHDPTALDPGAIVLLGEVLYQWCPKGVIAAPALVAFVERHFGIRTTARNWNTLLKLAARIGS